MVSEFQRFKSDTASFRPSTTQCKLVPVSLFSPQNRWDIDYHWTIEEKRTLGIVERGQVTVDDVITKLSDLVASLQESKKALSRSLRHTGEFREVPLSDDSLFIIHRGHRVTTKECKSNPGDVRVIASGRHKDSHFGYISEEYLKKKFKSTRLEDVPGFFDAEPNIVSVGATGSVGVVHIRDEERWFLHDDALVVQVLSDRIDIGYFRFALQQAITEAQFNYCAKLYQERLRGLTLKIPVDEDGDFDLDAQRKLAGVYAQQERIQKGVFQTVQDLLATDVIAP